MPTTLVVGLVAESRIFNIDKIHLQNARSVKINNSCGYDDITDDKSIYDF